MSEKAAHRLTIEVRFPTKLSERAQQDVKEAVHELKAALETYQAEMTRADLRVVQTFEVSRQ